MQNRLEAPGLLIFYPKSYPNQKLISFWTYSSNLAFAKKFFSSPRLNGTGVSKEAHRITGASKY